MPAAFLSAEWRWLAMVNYAVDPAALRPYVPAGTELDVFRGRTYVSLVGFLFLNTKLWGLPVPFHRNFEEVNLRFYVRRKAEGEWRRGVVFIREIVPRRAIAWTARAFYGERYAAAPMRHTIEGDRFCYGWRMAGRWNRLAVTRTGAPRPAAEGSEEQFITEHYWGYAARRGGGSLEYRVEHATWNLWAAAEAEASVAAAGIYGPAFAEALSGKPASAFLAEGSRVKVLWPRRV